MTKVFETAERGDLSDLAARFKDKVAKGEIVIVVERPPRNRPGEEQVEELLAIAMESMTLKDAVASVSADTGAPRSECYRTALRIRDECSRS